MSKELKCWSCKAVFTLSERADCDGCCWKCGVEIDLNEMDIPAAPQPPALGGDAVVIGNLHRDCDERIVFESSGEIHIKDGMPVYGADSVAPLQAEIERLKEESFEELYNAAIDERDQLKARCDAMEAVMKIMLTHEDMPNGYKYPVSLWFPAIDAALSKPAGSDQS